MSYVQGSVVRLQAEITDGQSGLLIDPPEVIVTIEDGNGVVTQHKLSDVTDPVLREQQGIYYYMCDTSVAYGTWEYQFFAPGTAAGGDRKTLTIRKRIPDPV
jgi:hypothetical protein